jgi:hypothetical protein
MLTLDGDNTGTDGIDIIGGWEFDFVHVSIHNFTGIGLKLRAGLVGYLDKCLFYYNGTGIDADGYTQDAGWCQSNLVRITNSTINGNSAWAVHFKNGTLLILDTVDIESNGTASNGSTGGVYFEPVLEGIGIKITNSWFEQNTGGADIYIDTPQAADQVSIIEDTLFVENNANKPTYGIYMKGSARSNIVVCRAVRFYLDASTADFYADGADATIYQSHCTGTTGGSGAILQEGSGGGTPGSPGMPDPTTAAGDLIYRASVSTSLGTNQATIALGASATESANPSGHSAALAIDGNDTTYAYPGTPVAGNWVAVNLGSAKYICGHRLLQPYPYPTDLHESASQYKVQYSLDNVNWVDIATVNPTNPDETISWGASFSAQYFRILAITGGNWSWVVRSLEFYLSATPTPTRFPIGTNGDFLKVVSGLPAWVTESVLSDPTTTEGDLLYRHSGSLARFGIGMNGQVFTSNGTGPFWQTPTTAIHYEPLVNKNVPDLIFNCNGDVIMFPANN